MSRAHRTLHPVVTATLARLGTLPLSLICALVSVRLMLGSVGVADYGLISLLIALQALLPFLDLGTGGGVLDGAAHFKATGEPDLLAFRWNTALRATAMACTALLGAVVAIELAGQWESILGVDGDTRVGPAVVLVAAINVLARPAQLATYVLQGLGFPTRVVLLQALVPVVSVSIVAMAALANAPIAIYGSSLASGQLIAGVLALGWAGRTSGWSVRVLVTGVPVGKKPEHARTVRLAAPMLLITLFVPLGYGLDRVILNHRSDALELATYSLVAQLLLPVSSLCQTAIQSLWGDLARRRHVGELNRTYLHRTLVGVVTAAIAGAIGFALLSPWVARLVSGGALVVTQSLALTAALVVLLQVLQVYPGALLTTAVGLRQQAFAIVLATLANVAVSIYLAPSWGAAGVLAGSAVGFSVQGLVCASVILRAPPMSAVREKPEGHRTNE